MITPLLFPTQPTLAQPKKKTLTNISATYLLSENTVICVIVSLCNNASFSTSESAILHGKDRCQSCKCKNIKVLNILIF